jgi:hypothetical protein
MKGWYITSDGSKHELIQSGAIYLNNMDLIELVIPNRVVQIRCNGNKLTELIIPDKVEWINCMNNNITELIVPDDCIVHCDDTCKVITRTMYNRSKRLKAILK